MPLIHHWTHSPSQACDLALCSPAAFVTWLSDKSIFFQFPKDFENFSQEIP
jgi:hypothetical protein